MNEDLQFGLGLLTGFILILITLYYLLKGIVFGVEAKK